MTDGAAAGAAETDAPRCASAVSAGDCGRRPEPEIKHRAVALKLTTCVLLAVAELRGRREKEEGNSGQIWPDLVDFTHLGSGLG